MPRYSVSVTVRLDADNDEDAELIANEALALGCDKNRDVIDFTVEDIENEDEGREDDQ